MFQKIGIKPLTRFQLNFFRDILNRGTPRLSIRDDVKTLKNE